jgi:ribosome-associated translation inhibitor RaiA
MIRILFKNMSESKLAREITTDRLEAVSERFPDLKSHRIAVTLSMDNSPLKPGPDLFNVKLVITGRRYKTIVLEKSSPSLYTALAEVTEHTLERLNRFGDKKRVRSRNQQRKFVKKLQNSEDEHFDAVGF